jgi:hypothetical protein
MSKQSRIKHRQERKDKLEKEATLKPFLSEEERASLRDGLSQISDFAETMQINKLNEELKILITWFRAKFDIICQEMNDSIVNIQNIGSYNVDTNRVSHIG